MLTLLDQLEVPEVILVGTSMGGLLSMLMAAILPQRISKMIINDIGPEINPRGLERIKGYVGKSGPVHSWDEAVVQCRSINEIAFPDFSDEQWLDFTQGVYREENGVPVLAYDPAIAQPMEAEKSGAVPPDMWSVFAQCDAIPMLVVRGAESDILSIHCVERMCAAHNRLKVVEVPHRGHAPTLTEPAALAAINTFLLDL
jgi:pimeloyl-ACP methyl ester carboxylesterase